MFFEYNCTASDDGEVALFWTILRNAVYPQLSTPHHFQDSSFEPLPVHYLICNGIFENYVTASTSLLGGTYLIIPGNLQNSVSVKLDLKPTQTQK